MDCFNFFWILLLKLILFSFNISGCVASLGVNSNPKNSVDSFKVLIVGQGDSGFTKSIVMGDTPPQSLIPDNMSNGKFLFVKLGGTWIFFFWSQY